MELHTQCAVETFHARLVLQAGGHRVSFWKSLSVQVTPYHQALGRHTQPDTDVELLAEGHTTVSSPACLKEHHTASLLRPSLSHQSSLWLMSQGRRSPVYCSDLWALAYPLWVLRTHSLPPLELFQLLLANQDTALIVLGAFKGSHTLLYISFCLRR